MNCPQKHLVRLMRKHLAPYIGSATGLVHPAGAPLVHVDILHFPPVPGRPRHTLVTCGMSSRPMCAPREAEDCRFLELYLCLPPQWPMRRLIDDPRRYWPFVELAHLARLPHLTESWVWYGHTIGSDDPEETIGPGVGFTAWIIGCHLGLPHEASEIRSGSNSIQLSCALPIYPEELDVARTSGAERLFEMMEAAGVSSVIEVGRRSCVDAGHGQHGRSGREPPGPSGWGLS